MRDLTDEELKEHEFRITNPYAQERLVNELAPGEKIVDVVNIYRYAAYPKDKARCMHCRRAGHRDGFTVKTSAGNLCLLGSSCGVDAVGATWHELERDFYIKEDRKFYLRLLAMARKELPEVLAGLSRWRHQIDRLHASHLRFKAEMEDVHRQLARQYRVGETQLVINQDRRIEVPAVPGRTNSPSYRYITETVFAHRMQGGAYFAFLKPLDRLSEIRGVFGEIIAMAEQGERPNVNDIRKVVKDARSAVEDLSLLADAHAAIPVFFTQQNLAGIAEWLHRFWSGRGGYFRADGAVLICAPRPGGTVQGRMSAPGGFEPLDRAPMRAVEELLRATVALRAMT